MARHVGVVASSFVCLLSGLAQLGSATEGRCQSTVVTEDPINLLQVSAEVGTDRGTKKARMEPANVKTASPRVPAAVSVTLNSEVQVTSNLLDGLLCQHDDHSKDIVALNPKDSKYEKWQDKKETKTPSQSASVVALLFFIAIAAGATYAILGLGTALVFHMSLPAAAAMFGSFIAAVPGIRQASVYIMLAQPAITAFQAWNLRNAKRNWPFLITYSVSTFFGLGGGMALLYAAGKSPTATFACKCLLLFSCLMTLCNEAYKRLSQVCFTKKTEDCTVDMTRSMTIFTVVACGTLAGFLQGAIAVGGTFKMMMIVTLNIGNEEWRSTQCLADLPLQFTRLTIVLVMGIIPWGVEWPSILGVLAGMGVGVVMGNYVAKHIPQTVFTAIVLAGIAGTSIMMAIHMIDHAH